MMRNLLGFILVFLISGAMSAQLTYSPQPKAEFGGAHSTHDIMGKFYVTNENTATAESVNWEIEVVDQPDGWDFQLCDLVLCYDYNTTKNNPNNPSVLQGGAETTWTWHSLPNGIEGIANYIVHIRRHSDGTPLADVPVEVTAVFSDTDDILLENVNIYPNPTESIFQIANDERVSNIAIYNIVGKEMQTFKHTPGAQYDVSDFQKGLYLVRVMSADADNMKVLRLNVR